MDRTRIKHVAEGFQNDAANLMAEFEEMDNYVEFSMFSALWKKYQFSLVFMGRPDDTELTEFTNEAFKVAAGYLTETSSHQYHVGGIFLLYGLFRNQISYPPIKIRLQLDHWKAVLRIREEASSKNYRSLHYVIDYLISHAFIYVQNAVLKGPVISTVQKASKASETIQNLYANFKSELADFSKSNSFETLQELQKQYLKMKGKYLADDESRGNDYEDLTVEMYQVLESNQVPTRRGRRLKDENIGTRRAELKATSFSRRSSDFWGRNASPDRSDVNPVNSSPQKPFRKRKHKHGRVGRPPKKPKTEEEEQSSSQKEPEEDITNLIAQHNNFFLPPDPSEKGKARGARMPYYKLSPKCSDDSS